MKILFASVLILLFSNCLIAQNTEGTIHYEEKIKLNIDLDALEGFPEEMKAKIPQEQRSKNILTFHPEASLYKNSTDNEEQDVNYKNDEEDVQLEIKMEKPESAYFYNVTKKASIESKELFGKKFLIGETKPIKWKITNETKEVLGYTCKKATTISEEGKELVEAWFTTDIPVAVGPSHFHGLPGAILSVQTMKGDYTIVATMVDFKKVDRTKVVPPRKGKKVMAVQFKEIVEAKQKEMADEYGGSGNVIIQTETSDR